MVALKLENNETSMNAINNSEKKRLESVQRKKQIFRVKELAVQNALKNLDNKSNKNKIIFDDDIDNVEQVKIAKKKKKRKCDLFDNDDSGEKNDELNWEARFEANKNVGKFLKQNITLGNDKRFRLDKRFIEDDEDSNKNVNIENDDKHNLEKEKELQLEILEDILGVPIPLKNKDNTNQDPKPAKKGMIRYDPTENDHKEYEINIEKTDLETKKVKKKKKAKDIVEEKNGNPPVEVSKDVYFSVSDSLTKSLKEGGQFSLLKTYGKESNHEKADNYSNMPNVESLKPQKFQFGFDSKNPFKYDSSDDEYDTKQEITISNEQQTHNVIGDTNKLFFVTNDIRFNEAEKFFSKNCASVDTFKQLRRELKQIVRLKIRRNVKKKQPWGYKKKVKKSS